MCGRRQSYLTMQVLAVLLLASLRCVAPATIVVPTQDTTDVPKVDASGKGKPEVYSLHIDSDIRFRFAHTVISSRIANSANVSQEVSFSAVLPETAFISGFLLEVDGKVYDAYVKEKEEAKRTYDEAVNRGDTAAHVALNARDSNRFTVSVNVEPQKKVTFNLTYEELLTRTLGAYKHVINLDPGQIVRDFSVEVRIEESSDITSLAVPALKTSNEIDDNSAADASNPLAKIERPTLHSAVVKFAPNPQEQGDLASEGIKGQLIVQYDVDRTSHPGEVLVNNGYFVHFFAPADLPPLRKQVTFVLDVSGSMSGRKIEQLRQAMTTILSDLNPGDLFSIILFSDQALIWDHALNDSLIGQLAEGIRVTEEGVLTPTMIATATPENITKAKQFVEKVAIVGGTNIYDGLKKALDIAKLGRSASYRTPEGLDRKYEPLIIFLTDGQPNTGISDPDSIVTTVTAGNSDNSSIFSLALGTDADLGFLKKLSLRNTGFARKIYEASDTALQLRDFYRQVASPLLANVTFKYQPGQVVEDSLTTQSFRRLFLGSELVVAGRLAKEDLSGTVLGSSSTGDSTFHFVPIPWPDIPHPPVVSEKPASPMERLWGYLTIKQLLEEDETKDYDRSNKNLTSPERQRALDLALKYSFVTPLTSLVVVKPNDTRAVDTEDASADGNRQYYPASGFAGFGGAGGAAGFSGIPMPANPFNPPSTTAHFYPPPMPLADDIAYEKVAIMEGEAVTEGHGTFTTPPAYTETPAPTSTIELRNLSDVTWLSANTTISVTTGANGTTELLPLASANETNAAYSPCTTPTGVPAHCRHFRYCVLNVFLDDASEYLPYFCRINGFAGVCCDESLHP